MDIRELLKKAYAAALKDDDVATPEEVTGYLVLLIQDEEQAVARAELEEIYGTWNLDLSPAPTPFGDAARIKKLQGDALASQTARADEKIAQVDRWVTYAETGIKLAVSAYTGNPAALGAALLPLVNQFIGAVNNPDSEPPSTPYIPVLPVTQAARPTGINAAVARGALPASGGLDSASAAHSAHGNPHHEPPDTHHTSPHH